MPRWSAASTRLPDDALRLPFAAAGARRTLPPVRCRARRHLDRRGRRVSRCSNGPPEQPRSTSDPAARCRRIERRLSHVIAASRRPRCARARCSGRWPPRVSTADAHRLHQSARHRHAEQRQRGGRRRSRACSATATPCSSTKGATGHTLGAAGALEAVICALALRHGFMPGGANTHRVDPALRLRLSVARTSPRRSRGCSATPSASAAPTAA